jgi:hypothetical protein
VSFRMTIRASCEFGYWQIRTTSGAVGLRTKIRRESKGVDIATLYLLLYLELPSNSNLIDNML